MFRTATLTALLFLLTGCAADLGLQPGPEGIDQPDDGFVPDAPSEDWEDEVEDEDAIEDEEEDEIEDEEEDEEEIEIEDEEEDEEEALEAAPDEDTFDDPLFAFSFLGSGAQDEYTVADAVSAPFGDPQDWVAFTTPAPQNSEVRVTFTLQCDSDDLRAQLWDDQQGPTDLGVTYSLGCGDTTQEMLLVNHDYLVRLHFPYGGEALVDWELTVSW